MKYRMQHNEHTEGVRLVCGDRAVRSTAFDKNMREYHEAAVEFWAEIERLQAVNAKLVSILKDEAIPAISALSKFLCEHGVMFAAKTGREIIERAEQVIANHNIHGMNKNIATVVNFARSQLDLHNHLPGDSVLGIVLKKQEWADFVEEADRMSAAHAELRAALKAIDLSDTETVYAIGSAAANQIRAAIARDDQAQH